MISIIIPICNTEQYIAQYIRMTGWRIKKILTTIYETAEKTGVDYVEMGMQRVMDRYGVVKKTGLSPVNGLIQQPKLFNKYYISFFGINIFYPLICGENSIENLH